MNRQTLNQKNTPTTTRRHGAILGWVKRRPVLTAGLAALLLFGVVVSAALLIRQDVATSPSAVAPDVIFQNGADYTGINAAGFATLTIGSSGTSASLALSGVPGAALVSLGNVMKLNNQDATQAYTVTLARSAAPNAAITDFTVTVKNGASTLATWNAASAASSSSFTAPAATILDISIQSVITDGTAAGALGSFGMQFSLVPV